MFKIDPSNKNPFIASKKAQSSSFKALNPSLNASSPLSQPVKDMFTRETLPAIQKDLKTIHSVLENAKSFFSTGKTKTVSIFNNLKTSSVNIGTMVVNKFKTKDARVTDLTKKPVNELHTMLTTAIAKQIAKK